MVIDGTCRDFVNYFYASFFSSVVEEGEGNTDF